MNILKKFYDIITDDDCEDERNKILSFCGSMIGLILVIGLLILAFRYDPPKPSSLFHIGDMVRIKENNLTGKILNVELFDNDKITVRLQNGTTYQTTMFLPDEIEIYTPEK